MTPRYSVVIPAYNEGKLLGRLLDSLDVARAAYGNVDAVEVIVADNVSTDRTAEIARARGCRVVPVAKRVIAAVRNAGARVAAGDYLAFVDADTQVHPQTFVEIDKALASGRVIGGATGATLERRSLGIAMVYLTLVPIALLVDDAPAWEFVAVAGVSALIVLKHAGNIKRMIRREEHSLSKM